MVNKIIKRRAALTDCLPDTTDITSNSSILVFDSGAGGISVLRELVRLMPQEHFIYYGDSANAPYGTRTQDEVERLTFDVVERYVAEGIKGVCVACNSATSAAVANMRKAYPKLPIVGIEPAVKPAAKAHPGGRVLVMATPMTVALPKFKYLMSKFEDMANIIPLACPGLMEFVERGETSGEALLMFLDKLLTPYKGKVDAVVTGCTHYPFVADSIKAVLGEDIPLFDGGEGTARYMRHCLEERGLLRAPWDEDESAAGEAIGESKGAVSYVCSSDNPVHIEVFKKLMAL